jgi:hypothetical protein
VVNVDLYVTIKTMKLFRHYNSTYVDLYLFQDGRWELGFTLDINGHSKPDWSTWLFSINLIFIHIEIHNKQ